MVLAVDIGFSYVKVKKEDGEFKFPSVLAVYKPSAVDYLLQDKVLEFEGKQYVVGEEALDYTDKKYTRSIDFVIEYAPLFLAKALGDNTEGKIVTGLPIEDFKSNKDKLKERLSKFVVNGKVYNLDVEIYPQGIGALASYIAQRNPDKWERGYILDIGFNTLIAVRYDELRVRVEGTKQYTEFGISKAVQDLQSYIQSQYNQTLNLLEANDVFLKGFLRGDYGKRYDMFNVIDKIVENYIDGIIKTLEGEYGRFIKTADRLVAVGGGAYYLQNYLPDKYKDFIFIPDNPEFANVRGYYVIGGGV